jgi:hypothetical protein
MADDPAYILDISGLTDATVQQTSDEHSARPWLGLQFECCGVYSRIYRNREATAYTGFCPRCARPVRVKIGEGGTNSRMFRAW